MLAGNLRAKEKQLSPSARSRALRRILSGLRDQEVQRLKELIHTETELTELNETGPGDEIDEARRDEDMDMNVSLIEMAEDRLAAIRGALDRLEDGGYGICEGCGEEIAFERLRVMPMTLYCVDCQAESEAVNSPAVH